MVISSKWSFIYTILQQTSGFVTPVVENWVEWEVAQWVHYKGLIQWPIALLWKEGNVLFNDTLNTWATLSD